MSVCGCEEGVDFGLDVGWALLEVSKDCGPVVGEEGSDGTMGVGVEGGMYLGD